MLPLFDIFLFYGRVFENKDIRDLIKESIDGGCNIRHKLLKVSNFLINLVDNPSKLMKIFTPS